MTGQQPGETYRAVMHARRPDDGEPCTLIVRRFNGRVELLYHGVLSTGATLSDDEADELAGHLVGATRRRVPRDWRDLPGHAVPAVHSS